MATNLRVEALLEAVPSDTRILDIGCVQHSAENASNDDWVHRELYDIGDEVVGLDYEYSEVQKLQDRGYNIVHGNAESFDLGETFDIVVAGELIEHLSNVGNFLDCVHDHLDEDGEFVLTTPNPWAFHRFKQAGFGEVFANEEHTCWFDERTIRQILNRHQFEITTVKYIKASTPGITSSLYRLGLELLGGTSLLVHAKPIQ